MKKLLVLSLVFIFVVSCKSNSNANESVIVHLTPDETVEEFIQLLGYKSFQDAYNLTANPNWGSYSEFSSKDAFGAINMTIIYELKIVESSNEKATIYAEVAYFDDVNGTNQFQQYFYLQKYGDDWKIINMELTDDNLQNNSSNNSTSNNSVTSTPMKAVYTDGSIYLIIYEYSSGDESFESILLNKTTGLCVPGMDVFFENDKWVADEIYDYRNDNSSDCAVDFIFSGNTVTLNNSSNCYGLNSTLTQLTVFSTPTNGTYSYETSSTSQVLEISEVDNSSIEFNLSVGTSGGCTGDIPEDAVGTKYAYGTNGVYIFDNWDGCTLLITFPGTGAIISEIRCDLHGMSCSFDGTYTKE